MYSLLVPFYDIEDFYYSGHISTTLCFTYACYIIWRENPTSKLAKFGFWFHLCFRMPYVWTAMTIAHTHYLIDYVTGVMMGSLALMNAEKVSYFFEVKITGRRNKDRLLLFHKPCPSCGWSNWKCTN